MDLVDEQHIVRLQIGELGGEVASLLDHGSRCGAKAHAHLARHDLCERRLAESGRAVEQHVVERLAPRPGGGNEYLEVLANLLLADEVVERLRTQRQFGGVFLGTLGGDQPFRLAHRANSCRLDRITASSAAPSPSRCVTRATAPNASMRR